MSEDKNIIYINGIVEGTSLKQIKDNVRTNGTITIYEKDNSKVVDNNVYAKTGMKLEIKTEMENINYILVVKGDNNGDGIFNSIDLLKLARYLADLDKNLEGEYLYSSDVYEDNKINQADLLKMARVISGLETL